MIQKIIKVGNSAAVIIPRSLLREAGFSIGQTIHLDSGSQKDTIELVKKGTKTRSSITPEFLAVVERVNKRYGAALTKLANINS